MITGYDLAEYLFSDNEEERLYSTENEELDELLERAFSDGYEYAQREFGNRENKELTREFDRKNLSKDTRLRSVVDSSKSTYPYKRVSTAKESKDLFTTSDKISRSNHSPFRKVKSIKESDFARKKAKELARKRVKDSIKEKSSGLLKRVIRR